MLIFKIRWPAGGVCTRQCVCSRTQQNKWPGAVALRPPPHFLHPEWFLQFLILDHPSGFLLGLLFPALLSFG
jgi:hypothetical protein